MAGKNNLCTFENQQTLGRIVFGEARGESQEGQRAVAHSLVNRVHHGGYPNSVHDVAHQKYGKHHQYNTLDEPKHSRAWDSAKKNNSAEYQSAMRAANEALCNRKADPTSGATDYCAYDPCSATSDNKYLGQQTKYRLEITFLLAEKRGSEKDETTSIPRTPMAIRCVMT